MWNSESWRSLSGASFSLDKIVSDDLLKHFLPLGNLLIRLQEAPGKLSGLSGGYYEVLGLGDTGVGASPGYYIPQKTNLAFRKVFLFSGKII